MSYLIKHETSYHPEPTLEGLSRELTELIDSKEPQITTNLALTSKALHRKTRTAYEQYRKEYSQIKECKKDLLMSEINNYVIRTNPSRLVICILSSEISANHSYSIHSVLERRGSYQGKDIDVYSNGEMAIATDSVFQISRASDSSQESILVSMFNIYRQRKDCTVPTIKEKIREIFDTYVKDYYNDDDPVTGLLMSAYLMMNAYAVGLPIDVLDNISEGHISVVQDIIERYILLVRETLEKLV